MQIDQIDQRLIATLRRNGRIGHSELSAALGVTRATVRARIEKLEQRGVIKGYTIITAEDDQRPSVRALTHIKILGHRTEKIVTRLRGLPSVRSIFSTNGKWDLVADIHTATNSELDQVLSAIREIEGIAESETNILLNEVK